MSALTTFKHKYIIGDKVKMLLDDDSIINVTITNIEFSLTDIGYYTYYSVAHRNKKGNVLIDSYTLSEKEIIV